MSIVLSKSYFVIEPFPAQISEYRIIWSNPVRNFEPSEATLRLTQRENEQLVKFEFPYICNEYHIEMFEEALEQLAIKMECCAKVLRSRGKPAIALPRYPHARFGG